MPDQRLRDTLAHLHEELAAHPELDGETADILADVLADITRLLSARAAADPESAAAQDDTLAARLTTATNDFETSYPRLTAAVTQVAEALSAMGI